MKVQNKVERLKQEGKLKTKQHASVLTPNPQPSTLSHTPNPQPHIPEP